MVSCCTRFSCNCLGESVTQPLKITNVEFLKGVIEDIPLPDNSVDVIISNCVINLSGDRDRVIAKAFRVLKPGRTVRRFRRRTAIG